MQHTTTYKYRRLEVFDGGSKSNYYLDIPQFEALVPDEIHTAANALLEGEARKVIQLENPHIIVNAVREQMDELIYYNDITEFKNAVDSWLFRAATTLEVCETEDEVNASKLKGDASVIYDIANATVWKREVGFWIPYDMASAGNRPWEIIGRLNGLCVNPDTGKFFLTNDRAPWLIRWPLQTSADVLWNADNFDPSKPWSILDVSANATGALYKVTGHNEWISNSVSLRMNNGSKTITFSDVRGFGTPKPITINLQENVTIKANYTILFSVFLQSNIIGAKVSFDQSSLPSNISYPTWIDLPATIAVPGGTYTFKFSDINQYWTPKPITIIANRFGVTEKGMYEEKLQYGSITTLQWKTGVSQTSLFTYANLSVAEWKSDPRYNDEASYSSEPATVLPL